jgi:lipid A ethanolaminephosphotransferase
VLAGLLLAGAFTGYYMSQFGVVMDPDMIRNVLKTHWTEARELMTWSLVMHVGWWGLVPALLVSRFTVQPSGQPWWRDGLSRLGWMGAGLALCLVALLVQFQSVASLMRNHKALRYQITPANVVFSTAWTLTHDGQERLKPRQPIGEDARLARPAPEGGRVIVVVVGETVRAANWGLSGYGRDTTPGLRALLGQGLVSFPKVQSCGTNTETSLPCMFSPWGRADYDEERIRGSQSLLHVLARAGWQVSWIDNQSGCKGVCEGLEERFVRDESPQSCEGGLCRDEGLLVSLDQRLKAGAQAGHDQLIVLHMLGNHGPAYFRRYPDAFKRFTPACESDDLARCSQDQIVNAYDNAVLYTDHVLAKAVARLGQEGREATLVYVSDHGESLGEGGLFLHGMPYSIAPGVQKEVPMVWWSNDRAYQAQRVDRACLQAQASQPHSHDHLYHTLLAWAGVNSPSTYLAARDAIASCRQP